MESGNLLKNYFRGFISSLPKQWLSLILLLLSGCTEISPIENGGGGEQNKKVPQCSLRSGEVQEIQIASFELLSRRACHVKNYKRTPNLMRTTLMFIH